MDSLIDQLRAEDAKINEKIAKLQGNSTALLDLLMERHRMYHRYENLATDVMTKFMISTMREDIFLQVMIYKVKADLEEDIAKIFSRLDDLETKFQASNLSKQQ